MTKIQIVCGFPFYCVGRTLGFFYGALVCGWTDGYNESQGKLI